MASPHRSEAGKAGLLNLVVLFLPLFSSRGGRQSGSEWQKKRRERSYNRDERGISRSRESLAPHVPRREGLRAGEPLSLFANEGEWLGLRERVEERG